MHQKANQCETRPSSLIWPLWKNSFRPLSRTARLAYAAPGCEETAGRRSPQARTEWEGSDVRLARSKLDTKEEVLWPSVSARSHGTLEMCWVVSVGVKVWALFSQGTLNHSGAYHKLPCASGRYERDGVSGHVHISYSAQMDHSQVCNTLMIYGFFHI